MWHLPHMDEATAPPLDAAPAPTTEVTATGPTPSRDVDRPPIGVNRWIAIGSMLTVFITATVFVVLGKADAAWWGGFVSTTLLGSLGITLGGSAVIKTAEAIRK